MTKRDRDANEKLAPWATVEKGVVTLTFGKYKGHRLEQVPESYLRWMMRQDSFPKALKRRIAPHVPHPLYDDEEEDDWRWDMPGNPDDYGHN